MTDTNYTAMSEEFEQKQYSDEEVQKILNTAKATRRERDEAASKSKELETKITDLTTQLDRIKGIDPEKFKELEQIAATYEERKLEEERKFGELKERWTSDRTTLSSQITELQQELTQTKIINELEKAFYSVGGKAGKDDDGYSYFDLIQDRAKKYIQVDDKGKLIVIDPRDNTPMRDSKGAAITIADLMLKLRSGGPTAALFDAVGNGAGSGMGKSANFSGLNATREQIMSISNRAERLTKARQLGVN
jgi:hypothetical protein